MMNTIGEYYWWIGIRESIYLYCLSCDTCQKVKKGKRHKYGYIKTQKSTKPFETVSIDICGPYPSTADGYRYNITIIDRFSKYCMIIPSKQIKTINVLLALQKWITYFGPPLYLLSDNGPQFISEIYKHFNKLNNTKLHFATTYHPETNGQIERLHRFINERIAMVMVDNKLEYDQCDWNEYMDIIQYTYNNQINRMTNFKPSNIILGYIRNIHDNNDPLPPKSVNEYIEWINNRRKIIWNKVRSVQQKYNIQRNKAMNDGKREKLVPFQVGDWVLYDIQSKLQGVEKKWRPTWIGPFEIKFIDNDKKWVKLEEVANPFNMVKANIDHIKLYHF